MSGLDAGRLNKRVRIEAKGTTDNGQGGRSVSWSLVKVVSAEVIGLSGDEALKANVLRAVLQWRVTIRRRDDVTTQHRLVGQTRPFVGEIFNIRSIMPDPKSDDASLMICETGGNASGA